MSPRPKKAPDRPSERTRAKRLRLETLECRSFPSMNLSDPDFRFVDELRLEDRWTLKRIQFTPIQRLDIARCCQKSRAYLAWKMGGGKTLAGIALALFGTRNLQIPYTFVIGPSIAIQTTWIDTLTRFGLRFRVLESYKDICSIEPREFLLLTLHFVSKLKPFLKRFLKAVQYKITCLIDEADLLSNPQSKRTQAISGLFIRSKRKYLLSGTLSRNNIAEAFTQLFFLYGRTGFFRSEVPTLYKFDPKEQALIEKPNPYFGKPHPGHTTGYNLFRASFNPHRPTVFGIAKQNQDVFNADQLNDLLDRSVISRSIKEIKGEDNTTHTYSYCSFSPPEKTLYAKIIKEFHALVYNYFNRLQESRKDRMMMLIRQINLLMKACTTSHLFSEFSGSGVSSKFRTILNLIGEGSTRFAIGCIRKETVFALEREIRRVFPERLLHVITGDIPFKRRQSIANTLLDSEDGILLSTQQSLSCSMNIDFIDQILIPELPWNMATLSQYTHRFIRFTSQNPKTITYIVHNDSIEANLVLLLGNKERLVKFIEREDVSTESLLEDYGVDLDLLGSIMEKTKDQDGKMNLIWSPSEIAS